MITFVKYLWLAYTGMLWWLDATYILSKYDLIALYFVFICFAAMVFSLSCLNLSDMV